MLELTSEIYLDCKKNSVYKGNFFNCYRAIEIFYLFLHIFWKFLYIATHLSFQIYQHKFFVTTSLFSFSVYKMHETMLFSLFQITVICTFSHCSCVNIPTGLSMWLTFSKNNLLV